MNTSFAVGDLVRVRTGDAGEVIRIAPSSAHPFEVRLVGRYSRFVWCTEDEFDAQEVCARCRRAGELCVGHAAIAKTKTNKGENE